MKKIIVLFVLLLIPISFVYAEENTKETVTLENCNSLNQIWINRNNKVERVGLLAYDTADTSMNKEIQKYACEKLKNASKIEIESSNSNSDKYNRNMVWIYVDEVLLQEDLISNGYGMVNHIIENYPYTDQLCSKEANAIKEKKGIWSLGVEEKYCDSGIILEKEEKKAQGKISTRKISKDIIIKITVLFVVALILASTVLIKVKHEEKR